MNSMHLTPVGATLSVEAGMLELFAPSRTKPRSDLLSYRSGGERLWRSDAIHRAKNMAQLSTSLANIAEDPSRKLLPAEGVAQARALSRAYDELGADCDRSATFPCCNMLREIVTRLTQMFGEARNVVCTVTADPIELPQDRRRALMLMASELVINALKYGYPSHNGGTIAVELRDQRDGIELLVEDDGVGSPDAYVPGKGGGLMDQLGALLGAVVVRTVGRNGHGFRVSVLVPIYSKSSIAV